MDERLAEVVTPLLDDLETTTGVRLPVRDDPGEWPDKYACALVGDPDDDTWMLVRVDIFADRRERTLQAYEYLREILLDAMPAIGRSTRWPRCPHHERCDLVPARVAPDGVPEWECPTTHVGVARVGELGRAPHP